ncbi:hypothetical protein FB451DRAFT_1228002 [Mycena latifolia]|nr:hypothetical protein FB451DRAFT_1228002 [Mycena latifolia]
MDTPALELANGMDEPTNPLDIQELLDQCIEFLGDSHSDLKACALVSRSWTSPAQARIFRTIEVISASPDLSWTRLLQVLRRSPHLIRHVERLLLRSPQMVQSSSWRVMEWTPLAIQSFSALCELPFTQLRHFSIHHPAVAPLEVGIALQQLLTLPTIERLSLILSLHPWVFVQLWDRCSSRLRHLKICSPEISPHGVPLPRSRSPRIALESLRIVSVASLRNWLGDDLSPIDLSGLKMLSVDVGDEQILRWPNLTPALRTIEVLDFTPWVEVVDLSALPNLVLIRMTVEIGHMWQTARATLATIAAPSRIKRIVIRTLSNYPLPDCCRQFDTTVVSLPVHPLPMVELETASSNITEWVEHMPQLALRGMLQPVPERNNWFENFVGV